MARHMTGSRYKARRMAGPLTRRTVRRAPLSGRRRRRRSRLGMVIAAGGAGVLLVLAVFVWPHDDDPSSPGFSAFLPASGPDAPGPEPEPWFRSQPPPPEFVTPGDTGLPPLMPDVGDVTPEGAHRAYEEALPGTVYVEPAERKSGSWVAPRPVTGARTGVVPAWRRNAVLVHAAAGLPQIVIVIDDAGVDKGRTARAIALPGPLTISFLTYADELQKQSRLARDSGHELMVHLPMEPESTSVDPGPNVLRTGATPDELRRRVAWGLSRFDGYVGVNNHMGSRFTASERAMRVVLDEVRARGLLFLDSRTTTQSLGGKIAAEIGMPFAERNVFLDNRPTVDAVDRQLEQVEKTARRHGYAIAIGHPRDATIEALAAWLPTLAAKGLQLVPLSTVVARRQGVSLAAGR